MKTNDSIGNQFLMNTIGYHWVFTSSFNRKCGFHYKAEEEERIMAKNMDQKQRTVAYLRVSTIDQNTDKFKDDILRFSNDNNFGKVDFIDETVSGVKNWRQRKLGEIIDSLQAGDRLIVPEMSRLGRSMLDVLEILKVCKDKDINVYALKGNWTLNGSIESKVLAVMFALISEIERDFIISRTRESLAAKKAQGIKLGRPKGPGKSKLDPYRPEIEALLKNGSTKVFVAKRYGVSLGNLYNWLSKNKIDITKAT